MISYQHTPTEDSLDNTSKSFREYYATGKYKGFYKLRERQYRLSGKVHVTFTNGEKEIFAIGIFKEEALKKIFDQIDARLSDQDSNPRNTDSEDFYLF